MFAKHVYYTTIQDSKEYQDQSSYTNYLLEQLSNSSHVTAINLDKEFSNSVFNANTNETAIIRELVGHYNESACFDNIIL